MTENITSNKKKPDTSFDLYIKDVDYIYHVSFFDREHVFLYCGSGLKKDLIVVVVVLIVVLVLVISLLFSTGLFKYLYDSKIFLHLYAIELA